MKGKVMLTGRKPSYLAGRRPSEATRERQREQELNRIMDTMDPISWVLMWLMLPDRRARLRRKLSRRTAYAYG